MSDWRVLEERYALQLPFFALRVDTVETGRGVVLADYPVIESRDWVCVVCLDQEQRAVMVKQYRHGIGRETLEFCAGRIDPGEQPLDAAKRELHEETGYVAENFSLLRTICPDTTRQRTLAHIFLATGARQQFAQALEPCEDVEVTLRRLDDPSLRTDLIHAVHVLSLLLALEVWKAA
jgi:8-oxo-dGTP pyrophosphatase MutT (NUDIX family)